MLLHKPPKIGEIIKTSVFLWPRSESGLYYCAMTFVWSHRRDTAGHTALCLFMNSLRAQKGAFWEKKAMEMEWNSNSVGDLWGRYECPAGRTQSPSAQKKHFDFQLLCSPCVYTDKWISISGKFCGFASICSGVVWVLLLVGLYKPKKHNTVGLRNSTIVQI